MVDQRAQLLEARRRLQDAYELAQGIPAAHQLRVDLLNLYDEAIFVDAILEAEGHPAPPTRRKGRRRR